MTKNSNNINDVGYGVIVRGDLASKNRVVPRCV